MSNGSMTKPIVAGTAAGLISAVIGTSVMLAVFGSNLPNTIAPVLIQSHFVLDQIKSDAPEILLALNQEARKEKEDKLRVSSENEQKLEDETNAVVIGSASSKIKLIAYFDPNCPHCRTSDPIIKEMLEKHQDFKVVYRDLPVIDPQNSPELARIGLALRSQNLAASYHWAVMGSKGRVTKEMGLDIAKSVGADISKLNTDLKDPALQAALDENLSWARRLNIQGTPAYIINGRLIPGEISRDELEGEIKKAERISNGS